MRVRIPLEKLLSLSVPINNNSSFLLREIIIPFSSIIKMQNGTEKKNVNPIRTLFQIGRNDFDEENN